MSEDEQEYPDHVEPWKGTRGGHDAVTKALALSDDHRARATALSTDPGLRAFCDDVRDAISRTDVTINVRTLAKAVSIVSRTGPGYLSGFEYHFRMATKQYPREPIDHRIDRAVSAFREQLGEWADARFAIEQHLALGPDTKYAALTPDGGYGLTLYGDICLVINPQPSISTTFFDGDSGESVRDATASDYHVEPEYLDRRFSTHDTWMDTFLANRAVRLHHDRTGKPRDWMKDHLAKPIDSVELHIHGEIRCSDIKEVRLGRRLCERLYRWANKETPDLGSITENHPAFWLGKLTSIIGPSRIRYEAEIPQVVT